MEIVLFEAKDGKVALPVQMNEETVWLTQAQMAQLFGKDRVVIGRHIRNTISDGEIDAETMCAKFTRVGKDASGECCQCENVANANNQLPMRFSRKDRKGRKERNVER